ncbi:MAG: serine hydrolase domain-containing protein [Cellvibrionaceae bacterium]
MIKIEESLNGKLIQGVCDEKFESVAEQFLRNYSERGEVGASVCVRVDDQKVVDLWGGFAEEESQRPWQEDTVSIVFSCTKAATALCAHLLVDRGLLDLNAPVSRYWPEFGQAGKESVTVAMMLNHSAGVPAFREPVKEGGYNDWDYMIERLEKEEPFWQPGTRNGYHMISFGWTVGELVRRVSGKSLGQFFADEIAAPLDLEFWIGLPESIDSRVAPMIAAAPNLEPPISDFVQAVMNDPKSTSHLALFNNGGHNANAVAAHRAEIGGAGGVSNARSLSKMFQPLANAGVISSEKGSASLLSSTAIDRMSQVSMATGLDDTLLRPTRFALGFMKSMDNRDYKPGNTEGFIIGDRAFGHVGAGGSAGFADPDAKLAFGYTMNQMGDGILLTDRGQSLVDATYQSLGYRDCDPGFWR